MCAIVACSATPASVAPLQGIVAHGQDAPVLGIFATEIWFDLQSTNDKWVIWVGGLGF